MCFVCSSSSMFIGNCRSHPSRATYRTIPLLFAKMRGRNHHLMEVIMGVQGVLNLPPSSGDLPWDDEHVAVYHTAVGTLMTSCAMCCRMKAQSACHERVIHYGTHTETEYFCSEICRDSYFNVV